MAEHIVAVFKSEEAAIAAKDDLQSAGIPLSAIRQYADSEANRREVVPKEHTSTHTSGGGFWAWLFGEEATSQTTRSAYTHDVYDRSVSTGHVVLSVTVAEDSKIHQAITVLEAHDPVDIDERSDEVSESATAATMAPPAGPSTVGRDFSSSDVAQAEVTGATIPTGRVGGADGSASPNASPATATSSDTSSAMSSRMPGGIEQGEEVLSLSEEQLQVGKRTVDRGTTRIRRYVVEKPVEENVTLRTERVLVERRQPLETAAPDGGAFEERVVEVRETAEEPVVAKTAHVVEEVVVGREVTERTETVHDTVRREDVEVSKNGEVKP